MFEQIFELRHARERQCNGPLAEERRRYLVHCAEQQMSPRTLRHIALYTLVVANALRLADRPDQLVTRAEIEAEADRWANRRPRPTKMRQVRYSWLQFTCHATRWLTFLGRLQPTPPAPRSYAEPIAQFSDSMLRECGLSPRTVENRRLTLNDFLKRIDGAGLRLDALTVAQVDDLLARKVRDDGYARVSIKTYASDLRAFFRFAEHRGWCRAGLAAGIMAPRVFPYEALPAGLSWDDVNRAIAAAQADRPADIRDRALMMLLAVYGLRASEAIGPATVGLRLAARGAGRRPRQASRAADLPAVPPGRGCCPPLSPRGAPAVDAARSLPHPPGAVPAPASRGAGAGRPPTTPHSGRDRAALRPPRPTARLCHAPAGAGPIAEGDR
jgi:integrase/recombinase XerD